MNIEPRHLELELPDGIEGVAEISGGLVVEFRRFGDTAVLLKEDGKKPRSVHVDLFRGMARKVFLIPELDDEMDDAVAA
jgi:hypothetical protein